MAGEPYRTIAVRFGAGATAVLRHKAHVSTALIQARDAAGARRARSLLDEMDAHLKRVLDVVNRVIPERGRVRAFDAAVVLKEVRETLVVIGKLTGALRSDTKVQVNIVQSPEWIALQERLITALRPFPEARDAVLSALDG